MSCPELVLHVGMPQSGGTMIQRALTKLRPQLRTHGVAYVSHDQLLATAAVSGWFANAKPNAARAQEFATEVALLVERELHATRAESATGGARAVLVSSHGLLGRPHFGPAESTVFRPKTAAAITQFVDAVDPPSATAVLYTHRQDRFVEYSYNQYVMAGGYEPCESRFPALSRPVMDYVELVDRICGLPRIDDVVVKPYELFRRGLTEALDDFLGVVGLNGRLDLAPAGRLTLGRMYSALGLQMALRMNPELETADERADVRAFLLKGFGIVQESDSRFLDAGVRRRILRLYADRNAELWRTRRPDLPESAYRDDAHTDALVAGASVWRQRMSAPDRERLRALVGRVRRRHRAR